MAQASGIEALTAQGAQTRTFHMVRILRLVSGYAILAGATFFFLGTSWDIQWHSGFLVILGISLTMFLIILFLKDVPLRKRAPGKSSVVEERTPSYAENLKEMGSR